MRQAYAEYILEHPEELVNLNRLKSYSHAIEKSRKREGKNALKMVQKWKEVLNGNDSI